MLKFYIAYSVAGTNRFTVATFHTRKSQKAGETWDAFTERLFGKGFKVARSRRPSYDHQKDGTKLHWEGFITLEGQPMKSRSWITRRFNELKERGWTIVRRD